nr:hypothetical protein [Allokutzneria albata]
MPAPRTACSPQLPHCLLAVSAGIWHDWTTGVTGQRSLITYDH